MNEADSGPINHEYAINESPLVSTESLSPEFKDSLSLSLNELKENLDQNKEASVMVYRETADQTSENERLARQILLASLGVKDHQVDVFQREDEPGVNRYQERILTNIPGVEIVYSDTPNGGRQISLAVNHDPSGIKRTGPDDIERVLRTTRSRGEWVKSVEAFGGHWNTKQDGVRAAELLSIDVDECIYPSVDRRAPDDETIQKLTDQFRSLSESMTIILNTNRSATETLRVLQDFEKRGVVLRGALTEGGAIMIEKNVEGEWELKQNPEIDPADWEAMQMCLNLIQEEYIDNDLGHAEPKISALTLRLQKNAGVTGFEVLERIKQELVARGLPTTIVERSVDVSEGGLQLLAGSDKSVGMRYIQDSDNIPKEKCISIGDSIGDVPMFEESGITASPYNAARDAKIKADYYSPFDAEFGILDIVNQIEHIKSGK